MTEKFFNLLDERWIRVIDENGRLADASLLTLLAHAHRYKRLANETETVDIAILRLLLAILHAVFSAVDAEGKTDVLTNGNAIARWKSLWEGEGFPCVSLAEYLEYFRERFYLFHPETPFYQTASLASRKCTEYRASKLVGDIAQSGNSIRLFSGRMEIQVKSTMHGSHFRRPRVGSYTSTPSMIPPEKRRRGAWGWNRPAPAGSANWV